MNGPSDILCLHCERRFATQSSLARHIKTLHPDVEQKTKKGSICSLCSLSCGTVKNLQNHIQKNHPDVKLSFEKLIFHTSVEFSEWKMKIERETQSSYIKHRAGKVLADGKSALYYYCHRSGKYNPPTSRKRSLKTLGSHKIDFTCPATITTYTEVHDEAIEITVDFQSTHLGHTCDVGRIPLNVTEKQTIAGSLQIGIPKSTVLKNIWEKFSPTKRMSYTTRKDLHNICRDFKIDDACVFHKEDAISVDIRVSKMQSEDSNSILIYKPVGEILPAYPAITKDEFLLGVMNSAQLKILELFGNNIIMIDSTHGTNQYGFQLTTVMVQDSNLEGFPVAILYSTRTAAETFIPFFEEIKKQAPDFKPRVFMSDDAAAFYNAFKAVFGEVKYHLICAWHIKRAWNQNLNSKIKDKGIREKTKIELEEVLNEIDVFTFEKISRSFVENLLKSEETKAFGDYFISNYMHRTKQWAYCYRQNAEINTNMKLERWHREIKYEEACGKIIKRLDKSLGIVLSSISKKLIGRAVALQRGKLVSKVQEIRKRHEKMNELSTDMVNELNPRFSWTVYSNKSDNMFLHTYTVSYEKECDCNLRCDLCNVCVHQFSCTCHDYIIRYIMCKHIHFVCKNYAFGNCNEASSENDCSDLIMDTSTHKENKTEELSAIAKTLKHSEMQPNFEEVRSSVINDLQHLIHTCQSPEISLEKLKFLKVGIQSLKHNLVDNAATNFPLGSEQTAAAPANKKINNQRRFPCVKKGKKRKLSL